MSTEPAQAAYEFKDFVPLIAALVGGLVGAVGGNLLKYHLDAKHSERSRDEQAKILSDSLRGEIKSLRDQMKTFERAVSGYIGSINKRVEEAGESDWTEGMRHDLKYFSDIDSPIYNASIGRIGLLWNLLSKEVVEFYADLEALKRFSRRTVSSPKPDVFDRRAGIFLREVESMKEEATVISARLLAFSKGDPYPGKRQGRQKHLFKEM
ncbi:hypothetical protein [Tritonibacter mobilis]|uniref:Uncharacterized protein n=1 Tax=Tritonibacter mobilis F1926 TaxID=1265309 RepID=A0A1B1A778_9RHOB|nr:hypothetical protein [Tritonibacter mobilis]ANP42429.1 hypothetical protein K529_016795 [Tritonibacter mobilis F1926]KJZ21531.1 hypothetical protein TW79_22170 [Tritonibacter mobilis]